MPTENFTEGVKDDPLTNDHPVLRMFLTCQSTECQTEWVKKILIKEFINCHLWQPTTPILGKCFSTSSNIKLQNSDTDICTASASQPLESKPSSIFIPDVVSYTVV